MLNLDSSVRLLVVVRCDTPLPFRASGKLRIPETVKLPDLKSPQTAKKPSGASTLEGFHESMDSVSSGLGASFPPGGRGLENAGIGKTHDVEADSTRRQDALPGARKPCCDAPAAGGASVPVSVRYVCATHRFILTSGKLRQLDGGLSRGLWKKLRNFFAGLFFTVPSSSPCLLRRRKGRKGPGNIAGESVDSGLRS